MILVTYRELKPGNFQALERPRFLVDRILLIIGEDRATLRRPRFGVLRAHRLPERMKHTVLTTGHDPVKCMLQIIGEDPAILRIRFMKQFFTARKPLAANEEGDIL